MVSFGDGTYCDNLPPTDIVVSVLGLQDLLDMNVGPPKRNPVDGGLE